MGCAASGPGGTRGAYGVGRARRPAWRWAGGRAAVTRAPRREVCAGPAPPPPATAPGPAGCGLGLSCRAGQTRVRAAGISAAAKARRRRKLRLCSGPDAKRRGRRAMGGSERRPRNFSGPETPPHAEGSSNRPDSGFTPTSKLQESTSPLKGGRKPTPAARGGPGDASSAFQRPGFHSGPS